MKRTASEGCEVDMTPMIDVVFQLIIFFIVTMKMEQDINPDIELEDAKHGPIIEEEDHRTMTVEIDRHGWISMHGAQLRQRDLYNLMKSRYRKFGSFPVLIRGDKDAKHEDIRTVMDICTKVGIWRIDFAAVQEKKPKRQW